MAGQYESLVDELLDGHEGIAEVLGVLHGRHVAAHLAAALCEGRTAKLQFVEREVYIVQA